MRRPAARTIVTSYAVAWVYLAGFVLAEVIYAGLSAHDQAAVTAWASTSVDHLHHDPVGSLIASVFVTGDFALAWPILIALALFGANGALGNWRTALVCAAGQVIGTLVSEGIVAYRVSRGLLPALDRTSSTSGPRTWSCPRSWLPCCTARGWREPRPRSTSRCWPSWATSSAG